MKKVTTLWGSRFDTAPDAAAIAFAAGRDVSSVAPADLNLLPYDVWLNKSHCVMLARQKIITDKDANIILKGLNEIESLIKKNEFHLDPTKEDVHTNIESWLIDKCGVESAGKLHTARSRNDQVVTDMRLYLRDQLLFFIEEITTLSSVVVDHADKYEDYVMPGFTHHQHAMITTFGHVLGSFATMFLRDIEKCKAMYNIINTNPLGSAAAFGTSFKTDRKLTTEYLGFSEPDSNSMDAITNRWEPEADLAYCLSSFMNHLSILAEMLILFSMPQFSFVKISDAYSTGSSIMPQKRNPDMLEVIKGKTAYVHGALASLLSSGKASYIGYNRDSQWTKYIIMDTVENCAQAPSVAAGIIAELQVNKEEMEKWSHKSYIGATSFLELLCQNYNLPFRQGKVIVEKAIRYSSNPDAIDMVGLQKSLAEEKVDIKIDEETLAKWQNPIEIINQYASLGSPSGKSMNHFFETAEKKLQDNKAWIETHAKKIAGAIKMLDEDIKKIVA